MSDNERELHSADSDEARRRAERIRKIKNSIRKSDTPQEVPQTEEPSAPETPAVQEASPAASENSWESELAERIAKRVKKVKDSKSAANSPQSILDELDSIIASNEAALNNEPEEVQEEAPAEEIYEDETEAEVPETDEDTDEADEVEEENGEESEKPKKKKEKKKKKKKKKKTLKESLLGLLPQKKDTAGERVRKIVFLGSIAAIIVCGYIVADYYIDVYSTESEYEDIMQIYSGAANETSQPEDDYNGEYYSLLPNADKLLEINSDIVGVINIPGTKVNYPIAQSDDLEKYLNRNIMGEEARAGAIFLDYRNDFDRIDEQGRRIAENSDNLIIYGHNMESGMMFGELKQYRNNVNFYGEHPIIELNSNYVRYQYKIFAFFIVDAEDETDTAYECWNKINFTDEEDFYNFVNEAKKRTIRLNDVDVQYGDKLLTLSTCNGIFGENGPGRLMVMARLVREGEDPYEGTQNSRANENIKWPTLYYKYNKNEKYDPDAEFEPYGESAEEDTTTEE